MSARSRLMVKCIVFPSICGFASVTCAGTIAELKSASAAFADATTSASAYLAQSSAGYADWQRKNLAKGFQQGVRFQVSATPAATQKDWRKTPALSRIVCTPLEQEMALRQATAPISSVARNLSGITKEPAETGTALLLASIQYNPDLNKAGTEPSKNDADIARRCQTELQLAEQSLASGAGPDSLESGIASIADSIDAVLKLIGALDTGLGALGRLVYDTKQESHIRQYVRSTAGDVQRAISSAEGLVRKRHDAARLLIARDLVLTYQSFALTNEAAVARINALLSSEEMRRLEQREAGLIKALEVDAQNLPAPRQDLVKMESELSLHSWALQAARENAIAPELAKINDAWEKFLALCAQYDAAALPTDLAALAALRSEHLKLTQLVESKSSLADITARLTAIKDVLGALTKLAADIKEKKT